MSQFRSGYASESSMVISAGGVKQTLVCQPDGEVTVPDVFDRLVPKMCPLWRKVELKAPEAAKPEAPKAAHQQHQNSNKGGK
jgi:hypothetical protein